MDEDPPSQERDKLPPLGGFRPRSKFGSAKGELVLAFLVCEEVSCAFKL